MSETTNHATDVIDLWPGDSRPERRRALAADLGHADDEKVRYWEKKGEIPLRDWQGVLNAAGRAGIKLTRLDFVRHLKDPAETATTESVAV